MYKYLIFHVILMSQTALRFSTVNISFIEDFFINSFEKETTIINMFNNLIYSIHPCNILTFLYRNKNTFPLLRHAAAI